MQQIIKKLNIDYIVVSVLLIFGIIYGIGKDLNQNDRRGDSAIFEQLLYNIQAGKGSVSNVFANTQFYIDTHLAGKTDLSIIEENRVKGPDVTERDMLKFHSYYILYPLSIVSNFMDSSLVLSLLQSLTFCGMLLVFYFYISRKLSRFYALIFVAIVFLNPNWYGGIQGWFYPDKLFVLIGVLFCIALYERNIKYLVIMSFIMILLNERAPLVASIVVCFYLLSLTVYANLKNKDFTDLKLFFMAVVMLVYAYITKTYILDNIYYGGGYLPHNIDDLLNRFSLPTFLDNMYINLYNNSVLIFLLLFSKRFVLSALLILSFNLFGNIGGAEKIGWTTHYHSYYFPIMAFAAAVGYINIINYFKPRLSQIQQRISQGGAIVFVLVVYVLNQNYQINRLNIAPSDLYTKYIASFNYYIKTGHSGYDDKYELWKLIKPNTLISTTEFGMAMLYQQNRVSFFPINIEIADYLFIPDSLEGQFLTINNQKLKFYDYLRTKNYDVDNLIRVKKSNYLIIKRKDSK